VTDIVLVLNAGLSSIKFSTFAVEGRDLALRHHGGIEGIGSDPRFFAFDAGGRRVDGGEHADVPRGSALSRQEVLDGESAEGFHPTQVLPFILIR
jgi:acetate kinase